MSNENLLSRFLVGEAHRLFRHITRGLGRASLFCLLTGALLAAVGEARGTGETPAEPFHMRGFPVPRGFIGGEATQRMFAADDYVRSWLTKQGVEFPVGSEATFDALRATLIVRAPEKTLDRIDVLTEGGYLDRVMVRAIFTLVEFAADDPGKVSDLTYEALREFAGKSWRVIERSSLVAKSGQKVASRFVTLRGPGPSRRAEGETALAPHELGTVIELEPQIGPDDKTVDVSFAYFHRSAVAGTGDAKAPAYLKLQNDLSLESNHPFVVHSSTGKVPGGKMLALVLQVNVIDARGRAISRPFGESNGAIGKPVASPRR